MKNILNKIFGVLFILLGIFCIYRMSASIYEWIYYPTRYTDLFSQVCTATFIYVASTITIYFGIKFIKLWLTYKNPYVPIQSELYFINSGFRELFSHNHKFPLEDLRAKFYIYFSIGEREAVLEFINQTPLIY